jgi:hypothetical protein
VTVSGGAPAIGATSQLAATAASSTGSTTDVTAQATWQTATAAIATVNAAGIASGVAAGEVDVRATFRGVTGILHLAIVPATFALSGTITDATSRAVLPNIGVRVTDGVNAGKTATTDSSGTYTIADVTAGTFALSASGAGYQSQAQTVTVSADTRADFVLSRNAPPPAPAPAPARFAISTTVNRGWSSITVTVNGQLIGTLRKNLEPGQPLSCVAIADTRLVTTVTPGTVSYSARTNVGGTWTGSGSIAAGGCTEVQLTCPNRDCSAPPPPPLPPPPPPTPIPPSGPTTTQRIVDYMAIEHAALRRNFTLGQQLMMNQAGAAGLLNSSGIMVACGDYYVNSILQFLTPAVAFVRLTSQTAAIDRSAVSALFSDYAAQDVSYANTGVWPKDAEFNAGVRNRVAALYASAVQQLP